mmetsp:Transcript_637/g.881  ORF Transcript_637/g.881 Transcript_637/m.881 type:complete len:580 (-) Transcript_637:23-1762(-)
MMSRVNLPQIIVNACTYMMLLLPTATTAFLTSQTTITTTPNTQGNNCPHHQRCNNWKKHDFDSRSIHKNMKNHQALYALPYDPSENITPDSNKKGGSDNVKDFMGITSRQFSLGYDISLSRYAGSMGFDEVVDWDYFTNPYESENELDRDIVEPPPLDPTKPKRTTKSSGGVVRLFLGELQGALGSQLRAKGLDNRVLVKEFSGDIAADLAKAELKSVAKLQNELCETMKGATSGTWSASGAGRYFFGKANGDTREDDLNLATICEVLAKKSAPFVGIIGTLNLSDFEEDDFFDPNEWYRFMGVSPPKPGSIWVAYEYSGLNTLGNYAVPGEIRRQRMPPRRGPFGVAISPPELPIWKERANYVVKGVLKGSLEALAYLHERGIAHRSIGRSSIIMSCVGMDKSETSSPFATQISRLSIKLSDFGFSGDVYESSNDPSFRSRARGFGLDVKEGTSSVEATNFAFAEDLHALGFVFLAILLTSLAEVPTVDYRLPATTEDNLQRLLGEIFDKDIKQFRDYCIEEDAWTKPVELLDENDGAGWELLQSMCFARERASELRGSFTIVTATGLLSSPFFTGNK